MIELYIDYRRDISALELRLNQISGSYLDSLAEVSALDEKQLQLQLDGILRLPDMRAVEVREAGTTGNPLLVKLGRGSELWAFVREFPLRHRVQGQEMVIGILRVEGTLFGVYRRLLDTGLTILASQAGKDFLRLLVHALYFSLSRHPAFVRHRCLCWQLPHQRASVGVALAAPSARSRGRAAAVSRPSPRCLITCARLIAISVMSMTSSLGTWRPARERKQAYVNAKRGSGAWSTPTSSGSSSVTSKAGFIEANDAFLRIVGYDREDLASGRLRWTGSDAAGMARPR